MESSMKQVNQLEEPEKIFDISMRYCGGVDTKNSVIDLYDLSTALYGLHRSLAITTHFVIHNEIITKAPYAKDLKILTKPAKSGSYEIVGMVLVAGAAIYKFGTAPRDTPIGHIAATVYEWAVAICTGKTVDYSTTPIAAKLKKMEIETRKIESLAQKIEPSVLSMHRPILTQSAETSQLAIGSANNIIFDSQSLDLTKKLTIDTDPLQFEGRVAGYNPNTRSGMIYSTAEKRAIPFELERGLDITTSTLAESLLLYDRVKSRKLYGARSGFFKFLAKRVINQSGSVKKYYITHVYKNSLEYDRREFE